MPFFWRPMSDWKIEQSKQDLVTSIEIPFPMRKRSAFNDQNCKALKSSWLLWLNPPPALPILEHFCPLFIQIAHMGLILPMWGFILPRIPPLTPVLYSAVTHTFWGYVHTQNIPKPTPKHPFSWPELESWQNELQSGKFGPQLGKMFEKCAKTFDSFELWIKSE